MEEEGQWEQTRNHLADSLRAVYPNATIVFTGDEWWQNVEECITGIRMPTIYAVSGGE